MMTYLSSCIILIALTPSALLQENIDLQYELWNTDSLKDCRCNYTLDLVPICENKDATYNRKEMSNCINKCSKNNTLNIIHDRECSQQSADQLSSKPIKDCKDCKLTSEFAPVCGNDEVTYPNPSYLFCIAECEKPGLLYSHCGFCLPQDKEKSKEKEVMIDDYYRKVSKDLLDSLTTCDCVIKYNLNPICGSDDLTYPNPSMLYCIKKCRKADLQIKSCGKCPASALEQFSESEIASKFTDTINQCLASCPVSLESNAVCGTDNKTYDNISILKCYNSCVNETISVQYYGTCDKSCKCIADKDYNPVCGSDGNTYANPSTLFCAEKCVKSDLKLSYCGKCEKQKELLSGQKEVVIPDTLSKVFNTCGCIFTKEYAPLCGSDGTVYGNPSIFYCTRKCMYSDITIEYCGDCNKNSKESSIKDDQQTDKNFKSLESPFLTCDCVATSTLYPVCGTDGVTYPHPSYIYCIKNCKANDASTNELQMAYCGPCKEGGLELPKPDINQDMLSSESLDMFEKCKCIITREWNPVCGTNNLTYNNPSIFYCSNKCIDPAIHIKHCGVCHGKNNPKPINVNNSDDDYDDLYKCRCTATREYKPVCGSDGNNYANFVILECIKNCTNQNIKIAYEGLCNHENKDSIITPNRDARNAHISQSTYGINALYARSKRDTQLNDEVKSSRNNLSLGCNCIVKKNYEPVCGTDGKTYKNLSKLSCNWCHRRYIFIDYYGQCYYPTTRPISKPCMCVVTNSYTPVCGSDGETYPNDQQLDCANSCVNKDIHKVHDGPCNKATKPAEPSTPPICQCDLTDEDAPLCGSDGDDYANLSYLTCFNKCNNTDIYKAHDGQCQYPTEPSDPPLAKRCACTLTDENKPVCASDGKTYKNLSQMKCANSCYKQNIYEVHDGTCNEPTKSEEPSTPKPCQCAHSYEYHPLCGSDGQSYNSLSALRCHNYCNNTNVLEVHYGPCENVTTTVPCHCVQTYESRPLCGSDGKDYANLSNLRCHNHCNNENVFKVHDGFCLKFGITRSKRNAQFNGALPPARVDPLLGCNCLVKTNYEPLCGTDGITYINLSRLSCSNRCYRRYVFIDHYGQCIRSVNPFFGPIAISKPIDDKKSCKCKSTSDYAPVCGSDGETYPNEEQLNCANSCNSKDIHKVHDGACANQES